jgi:toxin ParE1/3/4
MRELVFLLSADIDIQKAHDYYEDCQEGRGTVFMQHLDGAFTYLRAFPEIAPLFHGRYRRLLVPHYPYGIFYCLEGRRIVVAAVMFLSQAPDAILRRLNEPVT